MNVVPRLPLPGPEQLSPEQRAVFDKVVAGPRGRVQGPLRALIHSPELAARWSELGEYLRYRISLPAKLKELAIITVGRRWSAQVEWHVHSRAALAAGLGADIVAAIRDGEAPAFADPDEALVYGYTRELQLHGTVSAALHAAAHDRFGLAGVVELTALIGYYTMVSLVLNAHEIPLPEGAVPEIAAPAAGLAPLPPAR
jgi:4-carboxymuconolactone decarboxylase